MPLGTMGSETPPSPRLAAWGLEVVPAFQAIGYLPYPFVCRRFWCGGICLNLYVENRHRPIILLGAPVCHREIGRM